MSRADQSLFFSGHRDENQRCRKVKRAQGARALQRHRDSGSVIIGARRRTARVHDIRIARVIMAGDKVHSLGLGRIAPAQDGIDIGHARRLGDAIGPTGAGRTGGIGDERVSFDFEASAAAFRNAFKFRSDPVGRRIDTGARGQIRLHAGKGIAGIESNQRFDRLINAGGIDDGQGLGDGRIGRGRGNGLPIPKIIGLRRADRYDRRQTKEQSYGAKNHGWFSTRKSCTLPSPCPLDRRLEGISNYEYHPNLMEPWPQGIVIPNRET